jgi:MoaA/NifB/PqqE/SkfB family radical SAM enzyme
VGPTGCHWRIVQIHPTRRCNLRCLHCYSLSGPEARDELPAQMLCDAVSDSAALGYNVVSVSGGEPVLYRGLRTLLEQARACGMATTVTSNGMLLDERRLAILDGVTDVLAISLDGTPRSHDRMRASRRAFDTMLKRLDGVRRSGIRFGFIFTLTQHNVDELDWVAEFALAQGASLLQIHPLEIVGRAVAELGESRPDERELAFGFLEAARIQRAVGDRLRVQLDVIDRNLARAEPERVFAGELDMHAPTPRLAELVSPLIVEPDGVVVPLQYGFPREYALGNLHTERLATAAKRWAVARARAFRAVCREAFADLTEASELPFLNWYELVGQTAATAADAGGAGG